MSHYDESFNFMEESFGEGSFWIEDGGLMLDALSSEVSVGRDIESSIFDDGCAGIAEDSIWDAWAGTYLGTQEPRFAEFAEYIEHPAYDGIA